MASVRKIRITRSAVLFSAGLAGVAHEILLREDVRDGILVLLAGMMGLPAFLNHDEKRQDEQAEAENEASDGGVSPSQPGGG